MTATGDTGGGFAHYAYFYDGPHDYASGVASFLAAGLAAGEPALVAVPEARHGLIEQGLTEQGLNAAAADVAFVDMTEVGANPSRIIPVIREFTQRHRGRRTRFVVEPIWPGRTQREVLEATRHEALLNSAFSGVPTAIFCPYDASGLTEAVLADAARTHPHVQRRGQQRPSPDYTGADLAHTIAGKPLPDPPGSAETLVFEEADLPTLRRHVRRRAADGGLTGDRAEDLMVAVNEAATAALLRGQPPGMLRTWHEPGSFVCEVSGAGRLTDPLAGRYPPTGRLDENDGLWLVNQLCDLTELRSDPSRTVVRLHVRTDGRAPRRAATSETALQTG